MKERESKSLNKFISETGICSRRAADKMIEAGRVSLNGVIAQKGNRVSEGDEVLLDGQPIGNRPRKVYLAFHKPPGVTSTTDRKDRDNIIDFINFPERIFPIGRLDKASTGLILLTNDGDIVNTVLREEHEHEKEYIVKVNQPLNARFVKGMQEGVPILGTKTKPCTAEQLNRQVFRIILTQGLNRQIRRMCEYFGYKVVSLKRVRIMHIHLDDLPSGKYRYLTPSEQKELLEAR